MRFEMSSTNCISLGIEKIAELLIRKLRE